MKTGYQGEYYIVEGLRNRMGKPDKRWLYQIESGSGGGGGEEEEEEEYSHSPTYAILNLRKFDFT